MDRLLIFACFLIGFLASCQPNNTTDEKEVVTVTLQQASKTTTPEERLKELGITLPEMSEPVANYVKYVKTGNLIFIAGHGPCSPRGKGDTGTLGKDLTVEEGYQAARRTAICLLGTINHATGGDLSKVKRIVRVFGMVNSAPEFDEQHKVMNGCSDLLVEVFGEKGKHARAAVGMVSLPVDLSVEIEMVIEVTE
ncbi:MAG: RidA family protein [Bacteroidota bacterium]